MTRTLTLFTLFALAFALPTVAHADSPHGVQLLPDGTQVLVTKDVGNERWSIALDFDRATASGNVYRVNAEPAFLWCMVIDANGDVTNGGLFLLSCFGSTRCYALPCSADEWSYVADVWIPGSFFLP